MPSTVTTNMGLVVPTVGQEPGPDWANDLNSNLGILDQHNHSSGQGVPITPSGMNISSDLPINGNNLTTVKTVNFSAQSASLSGVAPNLGCIYVAGKELYYNDEVGNVVPITANGSVNAGSGSISGLPSGTASASYSGGAFIWRSATNTPANTDTGSVILRNITANSKGLTLNPPSAMGADIAQTLPTIPAATSFMTMDTSGNMAASINQSQGIVTSMIADSAITTAKIADASVTAAKLASGGFFPGQGTPTTITASQNYTVPSGVNYLYLVACGGGGGGGQTNTVGFAGGGGGAGAPVWSGLIPVTAGNTYAVTIGAAGSGANGGSATAGGATSFGSIMSTPGGAIGTNGTGATSAGSGGTGRGHAGGNGGNGATSVGGAAGGNYFSDFNFGNGGSGQAVSNGTGGGGGGSYGAGAAGSSGGTGGGDAAVNTGGGGGGGSNAKGGNGGSGIMLIYIV